MKKILICGSAGFIASNLMRYMLYRSKDYEFVSVDNLLNSPKDFKRVYLHRKHKFYIGDVTSFYFMKRLIYIEKPDYIVNAIAPNNFNSIELLAGFGIPTLQLTYPSDIDSFGMYKYFNNLTIHHKLNMLIFPNCFGLRQRLSEGIAQMISRFLGKDKIIYSCNEKWPWVYAEDIASLIWFIIENNIHGVVQAPVLGYASLKEISEIILTHFTECKSKIIETKDKLDNKFWEPICLTYQSKQKDNIENWIPDSDDLFFAINKTVQWYKVNKWAINVY